MAKEKEEQAATPSADELFEAALAERDECASTYPLDRDKLNALDGKLKSLALGLSVGEPFDESKEPVLAALATLAKSRDAFAFRLLRQPRSHVRLVQSPDGDKRRPDQDVIINGIKLVVPRGRKVSVPQVVADILEQAEVD